MSVFIGWPTTLGYGQDSFLVYYNFDDGPADEEWWAGEDDYIVNSVFSLHPYDLISRMKEHQRLTVRIVDGQWVTQTASWNIPGFRDSVKLAEENCPQ